MSVDAITSSPFGLVNPNGYAVTPPKTQSDTSPHDGIEDTISLSPGATNVNNSTQFGPPTDYSDDPRLNAKGWEDWHTSMELNYQYHQAENRFRQDNFEKMNAIHEQLLKDAGGILYGSAYNPDDLSKPITTTSGKPHPLADQIRAFVNDHKPQYDQMKELREAEFMSFEQWLVGQAKTA